MKNGTAISHNGSRINDAGCAVVAVSTQRPRAYDRQQERWRAPTRLEKNEGDDGERGPKRQDRVYPSHLSLNRSRKSSMTSSLAERCIRPHLPRPRIGVENSGGAGRDVEHQNGISAGLMIAEQSFRRVGEQGDRATIRRCNRQPP